MKVVAFPLFDPVKLHQRNFLKEIQIKLFFRYACDFGHGTVSCPIVILQYISANNILLLRVIFIFLKNRIGLDILVVLDVLVLHGNIK